MFKRTVLILMWWVSAGSIVTGCANSATNEQGSATTRPMESQTDIHLQIHQVYNFAPHTLDPKELPEKSERLDKFWDDAKSHADVFIPALRKELADFSNPPFFLFDGSRLLLSLSHDPRDGRLILAAVAHCDLRDVQATDYFRLVHDQAVAGDDTTAAALHVLDKPDFTVFVPQHAMTLGQNFSLIYLLFPTDPDLWLGPAIDRLKTESDITAQKSLLLLLWYAQTQESDRAIGEFSHDAARPALVRSYADGLLKVKDNNAAWLLWATPFTTEATLRQARRDRMKSISDEALMDFDRYTAKIVEKRK